MRGSFIKSYDDAVAVFATARSAAAGKPILSSWRMYRNSDGSFDICCAWPKGRRNKSIFRINPDNTFEVVTDMDTYHYNAPSITMSLHRIVPFQTRRMAKGMYHIAPVGWDWSYVSKYGYEIYPGLKMNLLTQECRNPQTSIREVDPEARLIWLRALRKFRKGVKVRIKMGAIEAIKVPSGTYRTQWASEENIKFLADCIRNEEYPMQLLEAFALEAMGYSNRWAYRNATFTEAVSAAFDDICKTQSIRLRREFGVFKDTVTREEIG